MGIEPTSEAWEASILPLYDARSILNLLHYTRLSESRTPSPFLSLFSKSGQNHISLWNVLRGQPNTA